GVGVGAGVEDGVAAGEGVVEGVPVGLGVADGVPDGVGVGVDVVNVPPPPQADNANTVANELTITVFLYKLIASPQ
ncbi:MAG: hypothetical protein RL535_916, partial [Pseudomonadota bacterium]